MLYVTGILSVSIPESLRILKSWSEIKVSKCSPMRSSNFSWGRTLPSFQFLISRAGTDIMIGNESIPMFLGGALEQLIVDTTN